MNHILSIDQFDKNRIEKLFEKTKYIKNNNSSRNQNFYNNFYNNKVMISFFGEPSTRTRFSFEKAMLSLGGQIISEPNSGITSSLKKGESFKDTFKTLSQYGDLIVCRHSDEKWIDYAKYSDVPVINAGNGSDQHPTQTLLDSYTIYERFGRLNNLKILFSGDLKYSRTVRSLIKVLSLYDNNKIYLCPALRYQEDYHNMMSLIEEFDEQAYYPICEKISVEQMQKYLLEIDVLYMTRIQKERFNIGLDHIKYFKLENNNLNFMKEKAIIMHPLPRNDEISDAVDKDERAFYQQKQLLNGLYIRTVLIQELLDEIKF